MEDYSYPDIVKFQKPSDGPLRQTEKALANVLLESEAALDLPFSHKMPLLDRCETIIQAAQKKNLDHRLYEVVYRLRKICRTVH
jgi:hypothetical protein